MVGAAWRASRAVVTWKRSIHPRDAESVACHEHGTALSGFLPGSWDHLDCQSWDHPVCLAGGFAAGSCDRLVSVVDGKVERAWDFGRSA